MKKTKEKKLIVPNECSLGRWIVATLVGGLIGLVVGMFFFPFLTNQDNSIMGISYATLSSTLLFLPFFIGLVLMLKAIAKTSLKDFVLGVDGKVNKKDCLTVAGLLLVGFVLNYLVIINNLSLRNAPFKHFAFLFVFMLFAAIFQTTIEELVFRGLFLRWACKNKLAFTKKALITAIISSLAFAVVHVSNPEVAAQGLFGKIVVTFTYSIPGFVFFIADIYFGNLLPGIIMHWLNNFILFTIVSSDGSVLSLPTLIFDKSSHHPAWVLVSTVIVYLPMIVYLTVNIIKKRKNTASADEQ